jgi:hypothetical protein
MPCRQLRNSYLDKLPVRLTETLSVTSEIVAVSAISCLEVAWLVKKTANRD